MRLLIYELCSAGGAGGGELAVQGFAMLDAVLADFAAVPGLELATVIARRLRGRLARSAYAARVAVRWGSGESRWRDDFAAALQPCDGALVIAPETDGLLAGLTAMVENAGKIVIGSSAAATAFAGNKAYALTRLRESGLPVPRTEVVSLPAPPEHFFPPGGCFALPVVVKPVDGTSCHGITLVADAAALADACRRVAAVSRQPAMLVQEYIAGEPASVSCLVAAGRALPLSVNRQFVAAGGCFRFSGLTVPYAHPMAGAAQKVARQACEALAGLAGFVGVDLVLGREGPVIMEINPRITAAYIALRQVARTNLAAALCRAVLQGRLPALPRIAGAYTYLLD